MTKKIGEDLTIFILDDEKDICHFSKQFFEKRGFDVRTSLTVSAALNTVDKKNIDIALLDIHLYKGNGMEVLKAIREKQPCCRCVMLTRDDDEAFIKESKKIGAVGYLVKPLTFSKIENTIKKIVKNIKKKAK